MSDFKTRLFDEKRQLEERIMKLEAFMESEKISTVDPVQQALLRVQLSAMRCYYDCLVQRIAFLD